MKLEANDPSFLPLNNAIVLSELKERELEKERELLMTVEAISKRVEELSTGGHTGGLLATLNQLREAQELMSEKIEANTKSIKYLLPERLAGNIE